MRTATWATIGEDVSTCKTIDEVLAKSGLDYEVYKERIVTESGITIPNTVATVANINGKPTNLGIVSEKYTICQNRDAFDFVDNISDELRFLKAGQTHNGMVYIIGVLPSLFVLGDEIKPHVILQNGHNGGYSLKTTICPLRIVCQNQFANAFKHSSNNVSILHSSRMEAKMENAKILLSNVANYMNDFSKQAEIMATTKLSKNADDIISAFFDAAINENTSTRLINAANDKKLELIHAYNNEDNQNFKGTVWGMANAFADYLTHKEVKNTVHADENKFMSVTFDPHAMKQFMSFVGEFTK